MKDFTRFIQAELFPLCFDRIDRLFLEMRFTRHGDKWESPLKLDLSQPKTPRRDKTIVNLYKQKPQVLEEGGESMDILEFYMRLHNISDKKTAVAEMCRIIGIEMPALEGEERWKAHKEKQDALEALTAKMRKALRGEEGERELRHLREGRGYRDALDGFIDFAEFGLVTKKDTKELARLFTYRNDEGRECCPIPVSEIGSIYTLAIPYRSAGRICGFVFRTAGDPPEGYPKYKKAFISERAKEKYNLFGLTGTLTGKGKRERYITIVEGEIDALRASYAGITNVVTAGSDIVSKEAIEAAKGLGVEGVNIVLDAGEEKAEKERKIARAIEITQRAGLDTYIVSLQDTEGKQGKLGIEEYLTAHKSEDLRTLIRDARTGAEWLCERIEKKIAGNGGISFKTINEFRRDIVKLCLKDWITDTDRAVIAAYFRNRTHQEFSEDTIAAEVEAIRWERESVRQQEDTRTLIAQADALQKEGKTAEALALLSERTTELKGRETQGKYSYLHRCPTPEDTRRSWKRKPKGVRTGYAFNGTNGQKELVLPAGALTFVCAPTSHGKTRMLDNLALRLAQNGEEGAVYYFTLEETARDIELQMLNIHADLDLSKEGLDSINDYYTNDPTQYFQEPESKGLEEELKQKEAEFLYMLSSGRLHVDDKFSDSSDIAGAVRYLHRTTHVKAVFIDHIHLMYKRGSKGDRKAELREMSADLMRVAKDTGLPIVLGAQLNRDTKSPVDMTEQNISDAADIEQSANIVMLLWNSVAKLRVGNSYEFQTKEGHTRLTDKGMVIASRGFEPEKEGKIYATLAKNRGGEKNIWAVWDINPSTGRIKPDYTGKRTKPQTPPQQKPQESSTGDIFSRPEAREY